MTRRRCGRDARPPQATRRSRGISIGARAAVGGEGAGLVGADRARAAAVLRGGVRRAGHRPGHPAAGRGLRRGPRPAARDQARGHRCRARRRRGAGRRGPRAQPGRRRARRRPGAAPVPRRDVHRCDLVQRGAVRERPDGRAARAAPRARARQPRSRVDMGAAGAVGDARRPRRDRRPPAATAAGCWWPVRLERPGRARSARDRSGPAGRRRRRGADALRLPRRGDRGPRAGRHRARGAGGRPLRGSRGDGRAHGRHAPLPPRWRRAA